MEQLILEEVTKPWFYNFIPLGLGIIISWASLWIYKYNCLLLGLKKPSDHFLFYTSILISAGAGYISFGEIIEYNRSAFMTGGAAGLLSQFLYIAIMSYMKENPKWGRVYKVIKVQFPATQNNDLDDDGSDDGMITKLTKTRFKK